MRSGNRKKYLAIMIAAVMVFQFSFFGSLKASAAETEPAPDQVTVMQDGTVVEGENETEDVVTEPGYTNAPEQQVSEEAAAEEQAEPAEAADSFEEPAAAEDQNQKQPAAKGSSKKELKVKKTKADEKVVTIKIGTLTKTFKDPSLSPLPNNEVPYTLEGDLSDEDRSLLTDIITFKHGNSTVDGSAKYPNAGTYSLEVEDPEVISLSMPEGYTFNYEPGKLVVKPMPVTVTIIGLNNTARYDGKVHHAGGFKIESSDSSYTRSKVELKKKYEKQANVNKRKPGKRMMGLKTSMFLNNDPNYDVTFKKVIDGYVKVYPKDGPVPEPEEDNNGSGSSSGNGNSSNGNSYGYYDANGNWINYSGGYYDANGNWVNYSDNGNGGSSASTGDNGNGNGNGSSAGQEGSQSGTETIDDSSTPTTDGSGTETIEDDDTPQTTPDEGENADDEEDGMNNILPIILAIIAAIIAFLIILFTKRRRNDSQ